MRTQAATSTSAIAEAAAQKRRGRMRMFAVLALCAAPVIASYFTYYVIRPQATTNYGTLIEPQRPMPADAVLTTLAGKPVQLAQLRGNWLLVSVDKSACDVHCKDKLYWMRQLRTAMGKERDRIDRVWLVTDDAPLSEALSADYAGTYTLKMIDKITDISIRNWLVIPDGISITEDIFLIDPQGNAMMRYPKGADANKIKRDISRLLRASASWHVAKPPIVEGAMLKQAGALLERAGVL